MNRRDLSNLFNPNVNSSKLSINYGCSTGDAKSVNWFASHQMINDSLTPNYKYVTFKRPNYPYVNRMCLNNVNSVRGN